MDTTTDDHKPDGEEESPALSPTATSPVWPAPRSPLPPHRLAMLANALGISTPRPALHINGSSNALSPLPTSPMTPDPYLRSPSPSPNHNPMTSKYLLHVVPPLSIPHDSGRSKSSAKKPPLPATSGYHRQFRRGIFVPVHPTLQAQLWAIAKEYALPSTTGIVLYLITANARSPGIDEDDDEDEDTEPGPRMSEDIWKHVWTRVLRAEQREEMPGRAASPHPLGFGLLAARSTPQLIPGSRPSTTTPEPMPYPSPSTPSSSRSNSKSHASEPDTPVTSVESDDVSSLPLPGLHANSIIPILAKVEFDIDKKKATWFDPWLKSRKRNHSKRTLNANGRSDTLDSSVEGSESGSDVRQPPIQLKLAMANDPRNLLRDRAISESPVDFDDSESESEEEETARIPSKGRKAPNVVDLTFSDPEHDDDLATSRPGLASGRHDRKNLPPPLVIHSGPDSEAKVAINSSTQSSTPSSIHLPYLSRDTPDPGDGQYITDQEPGPDGLPRTPMEGKRGGMFYEDLDLGLDFEDSQALFGAELDELQRHFEQFSPRPLTGDLSEEQIGVSPGSTHLELPPGAIRNSDVFPASPGPQSQFDIPSPSSSYSQPPSPERPSIREKSSPPPRLAVNGITAASPPSSNNRELQSSASYHDLLPPSAFTNESGNDSPIIPLSPDPFGRYPSDIHSSIPQYSAEVPPPVPSLASRASSSQLSVTNTSRFSTDSTSTAATTVVDNSSRRTTMVSSIRKLWRRSNKSISISPVVPPPSSTSPPPPASAVNPQFNLRDRSGSQLSLGPPGPQDRSPPSNPTTPTMSSFPASVAAAPPPPRPARPSQDEMDIPDIDGPEPLHHVVPNFQGRAAANQQHPSPIVVSHMRPSSRGMAQLEFDQESPYPIPVRRAPSANAVNVSNAANNSRYNSRPPSPVQLMPPLAPDAPTEAETKVARKSILKWKVGSSAASSSKDHPQSLKPRRPSLSNSSSGSFGRAPEGLPDIPPSPNVPEQFLSRTSNDSSWSQRSAHLVTPSTDSFATFGGQRKPSLTASSVRSASPAYSMASSRQSGDTRPSIDSSQFEIVSPRVPTLAFPHTTVDNS